MRVVAALLALAASTLAAQPAVTYEVTFDATWSAATFPDSFPPDPHFSPLVGAVHGPEVVLWTAGETATAGIERMAEVGATAPLIAEVEAFAQGGHAARAVSGSGLALSPGAVTTTVGLDADAPLLTLVTMLAPSPDWFVGVSGLDLRDGDGWAEERVVDLYVYDAGTDDGVTYTSPDADADPKRPIARLDAAPFLRDGEPAPVGTFTFRRVVGAGAGESPEADVDVTAISPNPVRGTAHIRILSSRGPWASVRVVDLLGRVVHAASVPIGAAWTVAEVSTHGWAPGLYVVYVESAGARAVRTFVVAR